MSAPASTTGILLTTPDPVLILTVLAPTLEHTILPLTPVDADDVKRT